jgi:hypothetical protein
VSFALGQRATDAHLLALLLKPGRTSQRPSSPSPGSTPPAATAPGTRWAPVEEGKHAQHSRNSAGVLEHRPGRSANEMPTCYLYAGLVGKQNREPGRSADESAGEGVHAGLHLGWSPEIRFQFRKCWDPSVRFSVLRGA